MSMLRAALAHAHRIRVVVGRFHGTGTIALVAQDLHAQGSTDRGTVLRAELIDEYLLMIHPLVLGSGRRLFVEGGAGAKLSLVEARPTTKGVILATYRPA